MIYELDFTDIALRDMAFLKKTDSKAFTKLLLLLEEFDQSDMLSDCCYYEDLLIRFKHKMFIFYWCDWFSAQMIQAFSFGAVFSTLIRYFVYQIPGLTSRAVNVLFLRNLTTLLGSGDPLRLKFPCLGD